LNVLADLTGAPPAPGGELDSSAPQAAGSPTQLAVVVTVVLGSLLIVTIWGVRRRRHKPERS
jgi:hypothetical protein